MAKTCGRDAKRDWFALQREQTALKRPPQGLIMSNRLGIDVGGTFTDLLLFDERSGAMRLLKTPSTPSDQSVGILNGIELLVEETGIAAADVAALLHGTTVSTNIVL